MYYYIMSHQARPCMLQRWMNFSQEIARETSTNIGITLPLTMLRCVCVCELSGRKYPVVSKHSWVCLEIGYPQIWLVSYRFIIMSPIKMVIWGFSPFSDTPSCERTLFIDEIPVKKMGFPIAMFVGSVPKSRASMGGPNFP